MSLRIFTTTIKEVIAYLDSWKKLFFLLIFMAGAASITLTYQVIHHWIIDVGYYDSLAARLKIDDKINPILEAYQAKIGADRLVVAELHDGKKNVADVRFAYMSGTYEADAPGITQVLTNFQNIPTSMINGLWGRLLSGECIQLGEGQPIVDHLKGDGAVEAVICPIVSPHGDYLIGVVMATWRYELDIPEDSIESMQRISTIVSGLIEENGK